MTNKYFAPETITFNLSQPTKMYDKLIIFFVFLEYTSLGLFILKVGGGAVPTGDRKIHSMIASN